MEKWMSEMIDTKMSINVKGLKRVILQISKMLVEQDDDEISENLLGALKIISEALTLEEDKTKGLFPSALIDERLWWLRERGLDLAVTILTDVTTKIHKIELEIHKSYFDTYWGK